MWSHQSHSTFYPSETSQINPSETSQINRSLLQISPSPIYQKKFHVLGFILRKISTYKGASRSNYILNDTPLSQMKFSDAVSIQ